MTKASTGVSGTNTRWAQCPHGNAREYSAHSLRRFCWRSGNSATTEHEPGLAATQMSVGLMPPKHRPTLHDLGKRWMFSRVRTNQIVGIPQGTSSHSPHRIAVTHGTR